MWGIWCDIALNKYTCTGHDGDDCEGSFSEELDMYIVD
jgi:delta-aminolevulinic acid dehydratase/porphobilinogen synthase